ncbi:MAG: nitrate reductase molybdenum cofactor assembly chaperone [Alphaproteobacteria bacterium]|nr:nitrate reductase molybdenum cofactor assembly chaperone [Alphaproteobacteria bacterium]
MTHQKRARTFKVLSALLSYPSEELKSATEELREVLRAEGLITGGQLRRVEGLLDEVRDRDLYDLQERYTLLFDRNRSLSLHLFEHVLGESRDRGQAMVDLAQHYEQNGFIAASRELPDFLPLFLEFLSVIPADEATKLLDDPIEIIATLDERLRRRGSSYRAVFQALRAISRATIDPARLADLTAQIEMEPDDLEALDKEWEETAVRFGPGAEDNAACGRTRLATRIRADMRDVTRNQAGERPIT